MSGSIALRGDRDLPAHKSLLRIKPGGCDVSGGAIAAGQREQYEFPDFVDSGGAIGWIYVWVQYGPSGSAPDVGVAGGDFQFVFPC
ncbi:MAG: hypothetical protein ABSG16_23310, partial [Candidatus Acidiferrum sp.]